MGDLAELWTQEYYEFIRSFAYRNICEYTRKEEKRTIRVGAY